MEPRLRRAIRVCWVIASSLGLVAWAGTAGAADLKRFPEYAYEARQDVDIEALKALLRQAQELQQAEDATADAALVERPAEDGEGAGGDAAEDAPPESKPASRPASRQAAKAAPTAAELRGDNQAGCMYRDSMLIWEKTPGTCKPHP